MPIEKSRRPLLSAIVLAALLPACATSPPPDRRTISLEVASGLDEINAAHRRDLDSVMLDSIEDLDRAEASRRLEARGAVVGRFDAAAAADRPVVALIDLWWNAAMLRDSARNGELREVFGEEADGIGRTAEETYEKIEHLASLYLTQPQLAEMREKIELAARDSEILEKDLVSSIASDRGDAPAADSGGNLFTNLLTLPLSPFTAARSVETGVADVVVQAQEFNRQFGRLPEQTRIQAERLMREFERSNLALATVQNMNAIGEASRSLAATAESLPMRLREEASTLIEESHESQATLAATVADARATAEAVNVSISNLGTQTEALEGAIREATAAGAAWERTADAVDRVLATVERIQGPPAPPDAPPSESSFSFEQIDESAVRLEAAALEVQGVLDRVLAVMDAESAERVEGLADRTLREATASGEALIDAIFWRSLGVVGLAAAGLVAFGLVRRGN